MADSKAQFCNSCKIHHSPNLHSRFSNRFDHLIRTRENLYPRQTRHIESVSKKVMQTNFSSNNLKASNPFDKNDKRISIEHQNRIVTSGCCGRQIIADSPSYQSTQADTMNTIQNQPINLQNEVKRIEPTKEKYKDFWCGAQKSNPSALFNKQLGSVNKLGVVMNLPSTHSFEQSESTLLRENLNTNQKISKYFDSNKQRTMNTPYLQKEVTKSIQEKKQIQAQILIKCPDSQTVKRPSRKLEVTSPNAISRIKSSGKGIRISTQM